MHRDFTLHEDQDTLDSWAIIVRSIIQTQFSSEKLWLRPRQFLSSVECHLELKGITLGQGHNTRTIKMQQYNEFLLCAYGSTETTFTLCRLPP